jgi:hypothetical protein
MITIERTEKHIIVTSEYHKNLPERARQIDGDWTGSAWKFDIRDEERVRELYEDIYGEFENCGDLVTVKIPVTGEISEHTSAIYFCGRQVARAFGRDSGAKTGTGVVLVDCRATSGGSMKNWYTVIRPISDEKNGYIEIKDVPRKKAESEGVEIVRSELNIEKLQAEKELLLKRIAEIDALIAG